MFGHYIIHDLTLNSLSRFYKPLPRALVLQSVALFPRERENGVYLKMDDATDGKKMRVEYRVTHQVDIKTKIEL